MSSTDLREPSGGVTIARRRIATGLELRAVTHMDRYGGQRLALRVTAYEGNGFAGSASILIPPFALGDVIALLEEARAGIESQRRPSQSHVSQPRALRQRGTPNQAADVHRLRTDGKKPEEIATALGISRASVYRLLKANGA